MCNHIQLAYFCNPGCAALYMSKPSHPTGAEHHSKSWMPSFVRRESELTSSFALTLQIQQIMARSLRRRWFGVSTFMAQVSAACSITLLTHDEYSLPLVRRGRWRLVKRGSNWQNLPHAHLQRVISASSQPPPAERMSPRWQNSGTTLSFSFPTSTLKLLFHR